MTKEKLLTKIVNERKRQGLTISEAAQEAGMVQPDWSRYENQTREASWERLIDMAAAVGLRVTVHLD